MRAVRVALNVEQFRSLVAGEEVTMPSDPGLGDTEVHIILSDVGFSAMYDALDYAQLPVEQRAAANHAKASGQESPAVQQARESADRVKKDTWTPHLHHTGDGR